jgi:hypothetical protein
MSTIRSHYATIDGLRIRQPATVDRPLRSNYMTAT